MSSVPMIEPSHVVALPKGQCFALMQGGQLWKVRMPLPAADPDEAMPEDLQQLAGYMRQHYTEAAHWWENLGSPMLQDGPLPDDLLGVFVGERATPAETIWGGVFRRVIELRGEVEPGRSAVNRTGDGSADPPPPPPPALPTLTSRGDCGGESDESESQD